MLKLSRIKKHLNIKNGAIALSALASIGIVYLSRADLQDRVQAFLPSREQTTLAEVLASPLESPIASPLEVSPTPVVAIVKSPTPRPSVSPKPSVTPLPKPSVSPVASPVVTNNTPPGAGYSRQTVSTSRGNFTVDIIAADLGSTRVIVDTASPSDCANDCPTLSLGEFVGRNGAFAGINGSYFCPATYPQCVDKKNSFDTLLMNKDKVYFNSDNNVYSSVPAVIFSPGSVRFIRASSEWGRDTGIDSMIANYPLLIQNSANIFGGSDDPKQTSRGPRSFVGNKGNIIYIGFVNNATVDEEATVLTTMGFENALHLDEGGSTALWYGGYKKGPGRGLANAILFVRR
jgi:hypothetical protein